MDFPLVYADTGIGNLLVTNIASLLQLLVNRLDVLVEVGDGEGLATIRALCALIVVDLPDVPGQVGHCKLLLAMWTGLLYSLVSFPNMSGEIINRNILFTVWTVGLLAQMNALNMVIQQLFCLKLLLTVGTLVVPDFLVEILHVVIQILVLLVADVTGGGL